MRDKIDQLALDANFLDGGDQLSLSNFKELLLEIKLELGPKNEYLAELFELLIAVIASIIADKLAFNFLEEKIIDFINFLLLNENEILTKKKTIEFSEPTLKSLKNLSLSLSQGQDVDGKYTTPLENFTQPAVNDSLEFCDDIQLYKDFISEARDHLNLVETNVLGLETNIHDSEKIDTIFRAFHTIKGVALFLKLDKIAALSHKVENVLDKIRAQGIGVDTHIADVLFKARDRLIEMTDSLDNNLSKEIRREQDIDIEDVLIDVENIFNGSDKLVKLKDKKEDGKKSEITGSTDNSIKVDYLKIDNLINFTGELLIAQSLLWNNEFILNNNEQKFLNIVEQIKRLSSELQKISLSMRMVTIKPSFSKMQRIARDVSNKLQKQVTVVLSGEDTELDRSLIEAINDPLIHMVRNSLDHGIELPAERKKAGKSEAGTLQLKAYHQGDSISIEVGDDGKGLDRDKILAKALESGLIRDTNISDQAVWQLIMEPGFSTAEKITDVSGRGVGMDVVRTNVEKIRGRIDIYSTKGKGTTMILRIPLTLAIILGMIVTIGDEYYIIPLVSIVDILRPVKDQIFTVDHKNEVLLMRGETIPIIRLYSVLTINESIHTHEQALLIVVEYEGAKKALMVDDILGQQEVVIKSINEQLNKSKYFSGCSILGNGRASLILNIARFFSSQAM